MNDSLVQISWDITLRNAQPHTPLIFFPASDSDIYSVTPLYLHFLSLSAPPLLPSPSPSSSSWLPGCPARRFTHHPLNSWRDLLVSSLIIRGCPCLLLKHYSNHIIVCLFIMHYSMSNVKSLSLFMYIIDLYTVYASDFLVNCIVEDNLYGHCACADVRKARRAFFAIGSLGSFHGKLNPLSARSIFEIFVIPVLLYGCETWILTPTLMTKLEKFQAEIGRRLLGISRYHADLAPLIGLHLPSMMARVFIRKLSFLAKLLTSNEDTQSSRTFRTCAADNVYNISLIQQCQWLQCTLNIEQILQQCLENPDSAVLIVKSARNSILRRDWANTVHLAKSHIVSQAYH